MREREQLVEQGWRSWCAGGGCGGAGELGLDRVAGRTVHRRQTELAPQPGGGVDHRVEEEPCADGGDVPVRSRVAPLGGERGLRLVELDPQTAYVDLGGAGRRVGLGHGPVARGDRRVALGLGGAQCAARLAEALAQHLVVGRRPLELLAVVGLAGGDLRLQGGDLCGEPAELGAILVVVGVLRRQCLGDRVDPGLPALLA